MLPLGLKITWCALSLAGLLSNLVGLPAWAGALGGFWIPAVYFMANAVLQIMFSLGMVWKMNPFQMPRAFCTAQAALMPAAWYVMTALCASMTTATSLAILRSYCGRTISVSEIQGTLRWRNTFLPWLAMFPTMGFIAYIVVALKLNALRPSEDMNCDATHQTWVRLLSYAGIPLLLALPSFLLSGTSAVLLLLSLKHPRGQTRVSRSRTETFTPVPTRRSKSKFRYSLEPSSINAPIALQTLASPASDPTLAANESSTLRSNSTHSVSPHDLPSPPRSLSASFTAGRTPTSPRVAQRIYAYHLPFSWDPSSPEHSAHPTPTPTSASPSPRESSVSLRVLPGFGTRAEERESMRAEMAAVLGDGESGSLRWARDEDASSAGKSELEFARVESYVDDSAPAYTGVDYSSSVLALADRTPWYRSSAVRQLVFFQLFSATTQMLAAVSSLVDIFAERSPPAPFGTQHVALLLAAWGPSLAFGVVPASCSRRPHR